MIKKRVEAALALCLCTCFLFAGCQPGNSGVKLDPKNPVSLEIWHYYNGPQKTAFDELVDEFNETTGQEQGIIVEAFSQGSVSELTENVIAAAEKKVGTNGIPDIFAAYADTAYQVDQMGLMAALDDYLSKEELAEYVPSYLEEGRLNADGKLKIFPTAKSTEVMMLNKTDWDKFSADTGVSLDSLKTIEGLTETARLYYEWSDSLTETKNDGRAFFGRDAMANYFIVGYRQLGTEIFQAEDGKVTLNADKDLMKKMWDYYYLPTVSGYFGSYGKFRSDDAKTGNIIAMICSTSGSAYFPEQVTVNDADHYDIESLVLPIPCFEGGKPYNVQQGAGMVVTKSTPQREYAATIFLKWFTEEQRNIKFSVGSGYLPVKTKANDKERIDAALNQSADSSVTRNLKKMFPTAIEMVKDYTFYTSKAFQGGTDARNVLEYSMADKAKQDRESVKTLIAGGLSHEEAVKLYDTQENFDTWYASFLEALQKAVQ